jgi:hypothetical protein
VRRLSCGSGSCLPAERAPSYNVPCDPLWAMDYSIKKSLVGMSVQLGSIVHNARAHVSKTPDARVMGLQDVWACNAFNACKTCG